MSDENNVISSYKSNSFKSREESAKLPEKKTEKVISGEAKVRKKGFFGKVKDSLIASDDTKSVGSYIFADILIPSVKKAISDIVTTGIDMILYGESRHSSSKSSGSKISYQKYYDREYGSRERTRRTIGYDVQEIVVPSAADAERALDQLEEIISTYGMASVTDFYDIVGVTGVYNDSYYGWTSIGGASYRPTRDGWLIILPKPTSLK